MHTKLDALATSLQRVGDILPRKYAQESDDWLTIWMMLVGAWRLLRTARPFLQPMPIDYKLAEAFARSILQGTDRPEQEWGLLAPHPWPAGFYLVSAEHRIANSVDRLTKVFAGEKITRIPNGKKDVPKRCKGLATGCLYCHQATYKPDRPSRGHTILARFGEEAGKAPGWPKLCLARVYMRVNEIKHGRKNQPPIKQESTRTRWREATVALIQLTRLMYELAVHRNECAYYPSHTT